MQLLDFTPGHEAPISVYESERAYALPLGEGRGEGHVYCIRIEPGGFIGPHEAGFGQLLPRRGWQRLGQRGRRGTAATRGRAGSVYCPWGGPREGERHGPHSNHGAIDGLSRGTNRPRRLTSACSRQALIDGVQSNGHSPMAGGGT
jgi:hypothetical protein